MVYFTADCHFGHENIIKFCNRPFSNADEMDATMIQNWNRKVHRNDTVYIIGDMFFRAQYNPHKVLRELHGQKCLVLGNHDHTWYSPKEYEDEFLRVANYAEVLDGLHYLVLCHYPMMTWNHCRRGNCYHVYGHIHNDTRSSFWPLLMGYDHALNAGVDINHFESATVDEMIRNNEAFKKQYKGSLGEAK